MYAVLSPVLIFEQAEILYIDLAIPVPIGAAGIRFTAVIPAVFLLEYPQIRCIYLEIRGIVKIGIALTYITCSIPVAITLLQLAGATRGRAVRIAGTGDILFGGSHPVAPQHPALRGNTGA